MAEENKPEEPRRGWMGNEEVGRHFDIVESGHDKFIKRAGQYHKIIRGKYGAEEVEGIGKVERDRSGKILKIGEHKVEGDLSID